MLVWTTWRRLLTAVTVVLCLAGAWPALVLANGGTVQLSNQRSGNYRVTVFTSPNPTPVGIVDVSVLVQRADSDDTVENAHVTVTAEPIGHAGTTDTFLATHANATNKLYYAANINLSAQGAWRVTVHIEGPLGPADASFALNSSPFDFLGTVSAWALALIPAALLAYLLLGRRRIRRPKWLRRQPPTGHPR